MSAAPTGHRRIDLPKAWLRQEFVRRNRSQMTRCARKPGESTYGGRLILLLGSMSAPVPYVATNDQSIVAILTPNSITIRVLFSLLAHSISTRQLNALNLQREQVMVNCSSHIK